jgi:hypothetical protein
MSQVGRIAPPLTHNPCADANPLPVDAPLQQVELLAAATETVNPISAALEPALQTQIRPAAERLSSRRAAPGKISGIVARLRRLVQRPLPVATARHTVSRRWFPVAVAVVAAGAGEEAGATERGSQSEAGRELARERLSEVQNFGMGLELRPASRRSCRAVRCSRRFRGLPLLAALLHDAFSARGRRRPKQDRSSQD